MSEIPCIHCHTRFVPTPTQPDFCCAGCGFVHRLLLDGGLERFYALQDGQAGRPVMDRPFQAHANHWLEPLIASLPADAPHHQLRLRLSGVTCVGCVWLVEKLFMRLPGAIRADIHPATAEADFIWENGSGALATIASELPRYGYLLEDPATSGPSTSESGRLLSRLGICAAFAMNTMAFALPRYLGMDDSFELAELFDLLALASATFALLIGGTYFFGKAIAAARARSLHIDQPIALGLALAYIGSIIGWLHRESSLYYFDFVAIFTTLMLGGRFLHLRAAERARSQLQGQSAIPTHLQSPDGSLLPVTGITRGDSFLLEAGQASPVAARLGTEAGDFSLAWMNGEPEPRTYLPGSEIMAGAIPLTRGTTHLTATEAYADSIVARLTKPDPLTGTPRSNRFLGFYLTAVLAIGIGTGATWLALGKPAVGALQAVISIFIISCPCAIGTAIPLVNRRAASAMEKLGVFIRNPDLWAPLQRVRHIVFDKTGTLTFEQPELISPRDPAEIPLRLRPIIAALTRDSLHPLSRSLHAFLAGCPSTAGGSWEDAPRAMEHAGCGSELVLDEVRWTLGKPGWRGNRNFTTTPTAELSCELARNGETVLEFQFRESIRPHTREAVQTLCSRHRLDLHILSGDQQPRVAALGADIGIAPDHTHAALGPAAKATIVKELGDSLYLGDGMNDTLAFQQASITGTPVADRSLLDSKADFLFTCGGLSFLPRLLDVARWRHSTVRHVVTFSVTYNLCAITACMFGHMNPLLAAILMPLSSICSLLIARRPIPQPPLRSITNFHEASQDRAPEVAISGGLPIR